MNSAQYISGTAEGPARLHAKRGERSAAKRARSAALSCRDPTYPTPPPDSLFVWSDCISLLFFLYAWKQTSENNGQPVCSVYKRASERAQCLRPLAFLLVYLFIYLLRRTAQGPSRGDGWARRDEDRLPGVGEPGRRAEVLIRKCHFISWLSFKNSFSRSL